MRNIVPSAFNTESCIIYPVKQVLSALTTTCVANMFHTGRSDQIVASNLIAFAPETT